MTAGPEGARRRPAPRRRRPAAPDPPAADAAPWRPSRVAHDPARPGPGRPPAGARWRCPPWPPGVGLALSLPPWGFWVLAFPAAGLLWWRLGGLRPRTRLWAGWLAGLGCYVPGLMWARSFTLAGAVVLIALEALFVAVACLAVPRGPAVARALAFPAAMTLAEAVRQTWPFGGLPIGGVFLGQADGPVLGVARLGGPLGLTAAVYVGGVGLAAPWSSRRPVVRVARPAAGSPAFDRVAPRTRRAGRVVAGGGRRARDPGRRRRGRPGGLVGRGRGGRPRPRRRARRSAR